MNRNIESEVSAALDHVRGRAIDRDFVSQDRLDVVARERVSAFPWRGQFTPGLVAALLSSNALDGATVLDPFVGSGTTLAEATRSGMHAIGAEVNPAAVELAGVFALTSLPESERLAAMAEAEQQLASCLLGGDETLFDVPSSNLADDVLLAHKQCSSPEAANLVAVSLMLAMGDSHRLDRERLRRGFRQVGQIVRQLPALATPCRVFAADARELPLDVDSVDIVLTSPPYINVFNYHQNYRPAIELLGWQVLSAARTEIGSNRKHRQNRFLTVVQYAIDMMLALEEFQRVCRLGAQIVIVIGRESRVRRVAFANGEIIGCIAELMPSLKFTRWQERKFTNRFGRVIYEEILTFETLGHDALALGRDYAAEVGRQLLHAGLARTAEDEVRAEVMEAIEESDNVMPSPRLALARATLS